MSSNRKLWMTVALLASSIGLAGCHHWGHCGKHRCKTYHHKACWASPCCGPKYCSPVYGGPSHCKPSHCKATCCRKHCRDKCCRSFTYRHSQYEDPEVRDFLRATLGRDHCWGNGNRQVRLCREEKDRFWGKVISTPRCVPKDFKASEWMERLYGPAPCW